MGRWLDYFLKPTQTTGIKRVDIPGIPAAILSALVFSGCIQSPEVEKEKEPAPMMFRIAHPIPEFDEVADSALLVISHPDMDSIYQPLNITDSTLEAEISGIIKGDLRHFQVMVFDSAKSLAFYGDGFSDEVPSPNMTLSISLGRVGKVKVEGTFRKEMD